MSICFHCSYSLSIVHAAFAGLVDGSFTGVISNAISIGGDSDTIAAIAGSIAEFLFFEQLDIADH